MATLRARHLVALVSAFAFARLVAACVTTVQPAPVVVASPTYTVAPAVPTAVAVTSDGERPDHRCGPSFGNAHCGANRCCSQFDWCGSPGEDHCGGAHGYAGQFDGPGTPR